MKTNEFREKLKNEDRETVERIANELYKSILKDKPKDEVQARISGILSKCEEIRTTAEKKQDMEFDKLKTEMLIFFENARNQLYFAPNRTVSKSRRENWDKEVKGYMARLDCIPRDSKYEEEAAELYIDLYHLMCRSCGYGMFNTMYKFKAIGIEQMDFYKKAVKRLFALGYTRERIEKVLDLTLYAYNEMGVCLEDKGIALVKIMKNKGPRRIAVEILMEKIAKKEKSHRRRSDGPKTKMDYIVMIELVNLCDIMLMFEVSLGNGREAAAFCIEHYRGCYKEIALFKALSIIERFKDTDKLWADVYGAAIKEGIEPREELVKTLSKKLKYKDFITF